MDQDKQQPSPANATINDNKQQPSPANATINDNKQQPSPANATINDNKQQPSQPPLSLSTILRYTWGMTMSLSSQAQQQGLSEDFVKRFGDFVNDKSNDPTAYSFLREVLFVISGVQRTYGFEREVYNVNINAATTLWAHQAAYYMNLTNPAALTSQGAAPITVITPSGQAGPSPGPSVGAPTEQTASTDSTKFNDTWKKIISFIGTGSGVSAFAEAVKGNLFPFLNASNVKLQQILDKTTEYAASKINDTILDKHLADMKTEIAATGDTHHILMIATIFVLSGALGFGIYTFFANRYAYGKIKKIDMEKASALQQFWRQDMKPRLVDMFYDLTKELQYLYKKYYNEYDSSLPEDEDILREYIRTKILPNDETYTYRSAIK
jgi:hypothetical protein